MPAIYDARFGPLAFPTIFESVKEELGDPLEVAGTRTLPGERRARGLPLSLPVYGGPGETDGYAAGDRLRRQVRSLMQNRDAKGNGLYFRFDADPELGGWLMVGKGDLEYAEGGVSLADYKLSLDECYRIGNLRTHRPARRLEIYDKRLTTVPRDIRGTVFKPDFAAMSGLAVHHLGYLARDPLGGGGRKALAYGHRPTFRGTLGFVTGRTHGEVVSFEQPEAKLAERVRLYDRRGLGRSFEPANLVPNPSFETGTAPWSIIGDAGANVTFARQTGWFERGSAALRVTRSGVPNASGYVAPVVPYSEAPCVPGEKFAAMATFKANTFTAGYWAVSIEFFTAAGAYLGNLGGVVAAVSGTTVTTVRTTVVTAPATASFVRVLPYWANNSGATQTADFWMDSVCLMRSDVPLTEYGDGDLPGWAWDGVRGASASTQHAVANLCTNPDFEEDLVSDPQTQGTTSPAATWNYYYATFCYPLVVGSGGKFGARCLRIHTPGVAPDEGMGAICPTQVATGDVFRTSMYLKGHVGGEQVRLVVGGGGAVVHGPVITLTKEWRRYDLPYTAEAAWPQVYFAVKSASAVRQTFYVDGAMATRGAKLWPYHSGNEDGATWVGTRGNSISLLPLDPQEWGWEEVFGADHPLTFGDMPVMDNGLSRVRYVPSTTVGRAPSFAVDAYVEGQGWQEQGRVTPWQDFSGVRAQYTYWVDCTVEEWTPDRAVVKVVMQYDLTGGNRAELYITLRTGDLGPRFELYTDHPYAVVGASLRFVTAGATAKVLSQGTSQPKQTDVDTWTTISQTLTTSSEPWLYVGSPGRGVALIAAYANGTWRGYDDTSAYNASRKAVALDGGTTTPMGYVSLQVACIDSGGLQEAELYPSGSSTATSQADAAAGNGLALRDTQTAQLNHTLSITPAAHAIRPGRYRVWVRLRVSTIGDTATVVGGWSSGSPAAAGSTTSNVYTWVSLGEHDHSTAGGYFFLNVWRSAGTGTGGVFVDRVLLEPLERRVALVGVDRFDGARDVAQASLYEARAVPDVVPRG